MDESSEFQQEVRNAPLEEPSFEKIYRPVQKAYPSPKQALELATFVFVFFALVHLAHFYFPFNISFGKIHLPAWSGPFFFLFWGYLAIRMQVSIRKTLN